MAGVVDAIVEEEELIDLRRAEVRVAMTGQGYWMRREGRKVSGYHQSEEVMSRGGSVAAGLQIAQVKSRRKQVDVTPLLRSIPKRSVHHVRQSRRSNPSSSS